MTSAKTQFLNKVTCIRTGGWGFRNTLLGDTIQSVTALSSDFLQFYKEACYVSTDVKVVERLFGPRTAVRAGAGWGAVNEMQSFSASDLPLACGFRLDATKSPSCLPSVGSIVPQSQQWGSAGGQCDKAVCCLGDGQWETSVLHAASGRPSTESFNEHLSSS